MTGVLPAVPDLFLIVLPSRAALGSRCPALCSVLPAACLDMGCEHAHVVQTSGAPSTLPGKPGMRGGAQTSFRHTHSLCFYPLLLGLKPEGVSLADYCWMSFRAPVLFVPCSKGPARQDFWVLCWPLSQAFGTDLHRQSWYFKIRNYASSVSLDWVFPRTGSKSFCFLHTPCIYPKTQFPQVLTLTFEAGHPQSLTTC